MITRTLFLAAALSFVVAAPSRAEQDKPRAAKKKTPAKKKKAGYDYERSKYKSYQESSGSIYRFNEKGEPIVPADKKKSTPADKKKAPAAGVACGHDDACSEKKIDADAL